MKTLVLFVHPYYEHSDFNIQLMHLYKNNDAVDFRDLYENYPDMHIAAFRERKRLKLYDQIIFHFPIIWFGMPPLLKLWLDEVLDMRWITEKNCDNPMRGKKAVIVVSIGGSQQVYSPSGLYDRPIEDYLFTLTKSLEVNHVDIKEIISIYNAKQVSLSDLQDIQKKITNHLNN